MKRTSLRCFFSITLFLLTCPSIFTNSTHDASERSIKDLVQKHEIFQYFMTQAKEQAQIIGFCVQQLCQTISAGKLKLTPEEQKNVLSELNQINFFINNTMDQLFVQNNQAALVQAILLNNALIDYLLSVINNDISKINIKKFQELVTKRHTSTFSDETMFNIAFKNQEKITDLVYAADHIGLTWYNTLYRGLKSNNAYSIVKATGIVGVSLTLAACLACWVDQPTHNKWYNKFIGAYPDYHPNGHAGNWTPERDANLNPIPDLDHGGIKWKYLDPKEQTIIQRIITTLKKLNSSGIIATSAALTLNYKEILTWMYKEPTYWAQEQVIKKATALDQKLQGTAKPNITNNGYEKVYFKDMVGCEELELLARKIANFMKHPERYERAQIEEHRGILLFGPPQTGKTLFAKALRTLIEEELDENKSLHFIDAKKYIDQGYSVEHVFWYAEFYAPCIIFFDEIDLIGTHRDKSPISTSQMLTCMQGIDMASKQIIVIGATNRPEQIDKALLVDGRFGKIIHIEYPKYQDRKNYLIQQLTKRCIQLTPEFIDCIAQETDGCSYNNLKRIITEAIILSSLETRPVMQIDFEKTIDTEVRKIQPANIMSEEEQKIVATYQAGKAVARHLLKTKEVVVKITTNPVIKEVKSADAAMVIDSNTDKPSDNQKLLGMKKEQRVKLGEVFTKSTTNHTDLQSDEEQEKECLALLAGSAALEIVLNKKFTQCNKHDRAEVMHMIYSIISQGEKIDEKTKDEALKLKSCYEEKIFNLLKEHKELLEKVINVLLKQSTIDRYEWQSLIS